MYSRYPVLKKLDQLIRSHFFGQMTLKVPYEVEQHLTGFTFFSENFLMSYTFFLPTNSIILQKMCLT